MTAPDKNVVAKPLHERIAEHAKFRTGSMREWLKEKDALLRKAAEALRKAQSERMTTVSAAYRSRDNALQELSRMRTALEEIRAMRPDPDNVYGIYARAMYDAFNQCAAIAERALSAGKDWSYCTSRGHEIGSQCTDAADCTKNGCALGRALTAGSGNE